MGANGTIKEAGKAARRSGSVIGIRAFVILHLKHGRAMWQSMTPKPILAIFAYTSYLSILGLSQLCLHMSRGPVNFPSNGAAWTVDRGLWICVLYFRWDSAINGRNEQLGVVCPGSFIHHQRQILKISRFVSSQENGQRFLCPSLRIQFLIVRCFIQAEEEE